MRCKFCYGVVAQNGNDFICQQCGKTIDVGKKYTLSAHRRRDGKYRSYAHTSLRAGCLCYVDINDFKVGESGLFYAECVENGGKYIHTFTTSLVNEVVQDGDMLTILTNNTKFVFTELNERSE